MVRLPCVSAGSAAAATLMEVTAGYLWQCSLCLSAFQYQWACCGRCGIGAVAGAWGIWRSPRLGVTWPCVPAVLPGSSREKHSVLEVLLHTTVSQPGNAGMLCHEDSVHVGMISGLQRVPSSLVSTNAISLPTEQERSAGYPAQT